MQPTVVKIDLQRCINCSLCRRACPTEAINYFSTGHRTHVIEPKLCIGCDLCVQVCPVDCISEDPSYVIEPEALASAKDKARVWAKRERNVRLMRQQRTLAAIAVVSRKDVASAASGRPQGGATSSTSRLQPPASSFQTNA